MWIGYVFFTYLCTVFCNRQYKMIQNQRPPIRRIAFPILIALSICAATNMVAQMALDKLPLLKGCQAHSTTIVNSNDEQTFRKLGIELTCDPQYPSESLYY